MKLLTKQAKDKDKDKLTYQEKRARQAQHKHEFRKDARKQGQTPYDSTTRQQQSWPLTARGALPLAHDSPLGLSEEPGPRLRTTAVSGYQKSLDHSGLQCGPGAPLRYQPRRPSHLH